MNSDLPSSVYNDPLPRQPKNLSPMFLLLTPLFFLAFFSSGYLYFQNRSLKSQLYSLTSSPPQVQDISSPLLPSPTPQSSPSAVPTPSISSVPSGWQTHSFSTVNLTLFAPANWKSDIQYFANIPSHLIRFWQGATPDTSTIRLNIKNNWSNTGDAQYMTKNYTVGDSIPAYKSEPPKKEERILDRYQTNYFFEY